MITLYGMGSPNVLKVVIALEELALPYRFEYVDVFHGEQFSDAFGRLTPNRKSLIIDEDGPDGQPLTLWESGAILIHGCLLPTAPRERLIALQWLMFQMAGIGSCSARTPTSHLLAAKRTRLRPRPLRHRSEAPVRRRRNPARGK